MHDIRFACFIFFNVFTAYTTDTSRGAYPNIIIIIDKHTINRISKKTIFGIIRNKLSIPIMCQSATRRTDPEMAIPILKKSPVPVIG
jgi:hypothetical protein